MKLPNAPYPSPEPDSPHMPVWTPSQFRATGAKAFKAQPAEDCSLGETIANSVSNGVGAALAIAGLVIVTVLAAVHGGGVRILVALAFAVPLLLAFLMSTLFHAIPGDIPKLVFKVLGHDFVFLFIAGAYTPYCVLLLADSGGVALCSFVWVLALAGVLIESIWLSRPKWLPLALCIVMCLAGLPLAPAFAAALPPAGWWLLVASIVCFAVGLLLYALKKVPYFWFASHLVVLGGSVCLFLSVALFVI